MDLISIFHYPFNCLLKPLSFFSHHRVVCTKRHNSITNIIWKLTNLIWNKHDLHEFALNQSYSWKCIGGKRNKIKKRNGKTCYINYKKHKHYLFTNSF